MASNISVALEVFHVLGSSILVGYFALLPLWKLAATRAGDASATRQFLLLARDLERRLVLPALGLIIVTGLALTNGPYATASFVFERWPQASLVISLILGFILLVGLGTPTRKMLAFVEKGEGNGPAMDKLWSEWRTSLLAGALLSLVALAIMVYKGSA